MLVFLVVMLVALVEEEVARGMVGLEEGWGREEKGEGEGEKHMREKKGMKGRKKNRKEILKETQAK